MAIINTGAVERTIIGKHDANFVHPLGDELVLNSDFSDDSNNWTQIDSSSITTGTYEGRSNVANVNILNTSPSSRIQQNFNYVNGKKYEVSVDVYVVGGDFRIDCRDSFVSGDFVYTNTTGSWVTLNAEIEANATGTDVIWLRSSGIVSQFYISNVSIKEVLVSRESTVTNTGAVEREVEASHDANFVHPLGDELITNGDFDTDSGWVKGAGWTISGGTANQDGSGGILRKNFVTSTDTQVKVTFDLTNYGGSGNLFIKFAPEIKTVTIAGNGTYTIYTDGSNSVNGDLQIISDNSFTGSIDNVSVKEVLVNRESTVTNTGAVERDIEGKHDANFVRPLGDELITNGDFSTNTDWTLATGLTIDDSKLIGDSIFGNAVQNINSTNGETYKVIFTVSDYVKGKVRFQLTGGGATVNGTARNANGVYTQYIVAAANHTDFVLRGLADSGGFTGNIDNVSVKEVLVSRESTVTNTGVVERDIEASHDANFVRPLGDELVLNGGFDIGSEWTGSGSSWSVENGKASSDGSDSSFNSYLINTPSTSIIGKTYKVVFTVSDYVQGKVRVRAGLANSTFVSANGIYTQYQASINTETVRVHSRDSFTGSIDNVSVKEVLVNRESTVTNTGVVERGVTGINESDTF